MLEKFEVTFPCGDTKISVKIIEPFGNSSFHPEARKLYIINTAIEKIDSNWGFNIRESHNFNDIYKKITITNL